VLALLVTLNGFEPLQHHGSNVCLFINRFYVFHLLMFENVVQIFATGLYTVN
jgi:hypothetical protein